MYFSKYNTFFINKMAGCEIHPARMNYAFLILLFNSCVNNSLVEIEQRVALTVVDLSIHNIIVNI